MEDTILVCRECDWVGTPRLWWVNFGPLKRLEASCRECGTWIQHIPLTAEWIALAEAQGAVQQGALV